MSESEQMKSHVLLSTFKLRKRFNQIDKKMTLRHRTPKYSKFSTTNKPIGSSILIIPYRKTINCFWYSFNYRFFFARLRYYYSIPLIDWYQSLSILCSSIQSNSVVSNIKHWQKWQILFCTSYNFGKTVIRIFSLYIEQDLIISVFCGELQTAR